MVLFIYSPVKHFNLCTLILVIKPFGMLKRWKVTLFFLQMLSRVSRKECVCVRTLSCFSHVWLFCDPMDCSPPGSSVHGILQARIGCHPLLQGIFPSQESNLRLQEGLLESILHILSSPFKLLWPTNVCWMNQVPTWSIGKFWRTLEDFGSLLRKLRGGLLSSEFETVFLPLVNHCCPLHDSASFLLSLIVQGWMGGRTCIHFVFRLACFRILLPQRLFL